MDGAKLLLPTPLRQVLAGLFVILGLFVVSARFGFARTVPKAQERRDPYQLLAKSFEHKSPVNVQAIVKVFGPNGRKQTVKLIADTEGRQRLTVIYPIEEGGLEVLILGDTTEVLEPDHGRLHISPTAGGEPMSVSTRVALLKKNYDLTLHDGYYLAGHKAVKVVARNRHPELGTIEFFVDPETCCVLRMEQKGAGSSDKVLYETVHLEYPEELPDDAFEITIKNVTIVKDSVPVKVSGRRHARKLLGTTPIIPKRLPLGFQVTRMYFSESQVNVGGDHGGDGKPEMVPVKALDLEVSDGIISATVHEIRKDGIPENVLSMLREKHRNYTIIGNLVLAVRGEVSPKTEKAILEGFKNQK